MMELADVLDQQSGLPFWRGVLWLPPGAPDAFVVFLAGLVKFGAVVLPAYLLFQYVERKFSADLQARVGPNRAGFHGSLQVIADFLKLVGKRREMNLGGVIRPQPILFALLLMALFSSLSVLPIGGLATDEGTELTLFLPFWLASVCGLVVVWIGLESNGVTGWLSAMRLISQFLAGLIPSLLTLLSVIIRAGSHQLSGVVASQSSEPLGWGVFSDPLQPVAFGVFLMGSMMMSGFAPMDGALILGDLAGGVASFASGRHQHLLRVARFYAMFFWASLAVALFLGGWSLPTGISAPLVNSEAWGLLGFLQIALTLIKTFAVMFAMVLVSRVIPRPRVDLVSEISWKILTPLALLSLVFSAVWKGVVSP